MSRAYDDLAFPAPAPPQAAAARLALCLYCARVFESERECASCGAPLRQAATPPQRAALERLLAAQRAGHAAGAAAAAAAARPAAELLLAGGGGGGGGEGGAHPLAALLGGADGGVGGGAAAAAGDALAALLGRLQLGGGTDGAQAAWLAAALLGGGGGGGGGGDGEARPAAAAAVAALPRVRVRDAAVDLPRTLALRLAGGGELLALPASFGPQLAAGARVGAAPLVACEPADAAAALRNGAALRGAIALAERGGVSFAAKARRAAEAGALALVVVNSAAAAWPYTMTDSAGEAAAGPSALALPCVMVRHADGPRLRAAAAAELVAASTADDGCAVCCEALDAAGGVAAVMPCQHAFHERCLLPWLSRRSTCPLCRAPLPEAEPEAGGAALQQLRRAAERGERLERERDAATAAWFG